MNMAYLEFKEEAAKAEGSGEQEEEKERIKTPEGKGMQKGVQGGGEGRGKRDAGIPDKEV